MQQFFLCYDCKAADDIIVEINLLYNYSGATL